ncbi:MAG: type II secretion system protein [Gammaproteobacteria bacterium]|nr:type II secretion system protein [Gammaproteobacteria bacterium]
MPFYKRSGQSGFTLVELLIVVIILAVLASVAIPQFSSSTDDAKSAALDSTLAEMRNAIEMYYHQHNEYPSSKAAGGSFGAVDTSDAFTNQLIMYTDSDGTVSTTKDATHKYGPYLKKQQLPANPLDESTALLIVTTGNLSATGTDAGGWWFDNVSGKFMANKAGNYNR